MRTLTFLIALVLSAPLFAQDIPLGLHLLDDGRMVAVAYDMEIGEFSVTSEATSSIGNPTFTSSWIDIDGVSHEVVTPVIGGGETGMQNAFSLHRQMVLMMQGTYPPIPVNHGGAAFAELETIFAFFQIQGPNPASDTGKSSKITTQWVSAGNQGHIVETPVPLPATPQSIAAAVETHLMLVAAVQAAFPPIPIPGSGGIFSLLATSSDRLSLAA